DAGQARRRWWGRPNTGPSPGPGYPARSREPRAWVHRWTATPDSGRDCRPRPRATPAASRRGRAAAVAGRCSCSDIHAQWRIVIRLVDVVAESTNDGALQALAQLGIGQGLVVRIGQYENIIHTLTQRDDARILHADVQIAKYYSDFRQRPRPEWRRAGSRVGQRLAPGAPELADAAGLGAGRAPVGVQQDLGAQSDVVGGDRPGVLTAQVELVDGRRRHREQVVLLGGIAED